MICSELSKWFREWLFIGLAEYDVTFGEEAQIEALRESSIYFLLTHSFQLPTLCLNIHSAIHFADISRALKNKKVKKIWNKVENWTWLRTYWKSLSLGKINKLHLPSISLSLFKWNLHKEVVLQFWLLVAEIAL